ncbi:protein-export chaperone SecB [Micavibrio aeruginosavorus]|uniref:protein-export chaperone SecB n=1 Tax=Micavibrio aeruginosavorus TaxID=349221 RepID=UPI003F4AB954
MTDASTQSAPLDVRPMPLTIHAQYVKDVSFENPNAPHSLRPSAEKPEIKVNVNMELNGMPEVPGSPQMYEVSLRIRCASKRGDMTLFVAEIEYAAAVSAGPEVAQETMHPMMLIEVPRLIFPFARQILGDLSQQAGYPPLLIGPIDFQQLYIQRFAPDLQQKADQMARA